jgi:DMSO/TMAO reductase YedYZ molybdopterin-dependent catalytic subunit
LSDGHLAPAYPASAITPLKPNGDYGLDDDVDADGWRLKVESDSGSAVSLRLADIQNLPRLTQIVKLHCIEGWSAVVQWTGARFADFTRKYLPPGQAMPRYVYMETPDSNYYVGLDAKSAMHPQTLLCYERNGQPLEDEHGAPLRLVIPVKYGIKSIKRVGLIRYTNTRPADYWAEQGYDWFAGL